jgi:hypothetical protein
MTAAERIAKALDGALALGLPAFPCGPDKAPACPRGFHAATSNPAALRELWHRYPGPLVGVPTGEASGLDALDIDAPRHPEATAWWREISHRVPPTRIHGTRSGGLHVLFRHRPGLRCWAGRPVAGIDGRADGGYVVWWPVAWLPLISDASTVPWPEWLISELEPPPVTDHSAPARETPGLSDHRAASRYADAALRDATLRVACAPVGSRNDALNGEAYGLGRLVVTGCSTDKPSPIPWPRPP